MTGRNWQRLAFGFGWFDLGALDSLCRVLWGTRFPWPILPDQDPYLRRPAVGRERSARLALSDAGQLA